MAHDVNSFDLPVIAETAAARRAALFRETPVETVERWLLGTAWALKPGRIAGLPALARTWLWDLIRHREELPDPRHALEQPPGLCGIVHDLSVATLLEAYRRGLFTFTHFGPLKWFSPPERCVLFFDETHIAKRLRRQMRQGHYRVTFDRDFEGVIKACADRRPGKWHVTWITPRIMRAYADLFDAGYVHSFEVWNKTGELVGGGYGVALGRVFFTESQFSREPNTSKIGFTMLNWHLHHRGFVLNDGKWATPTICDMGFRSIPRTEFLSRLDQHVRAETTPARWQVEADPAIVADWATAAEPVPAPVEDAPRARIVSAEGARHVARKGMLLYPAVDALDGEVMGFSLAYVSTMFHSLVC